MKSKTVLVLLAIGLLGLSVALVGCSKTREEATSTHENGARMGEGAAPGDEMVACAYDGMHMKRMAMRASTEYKGETLYFCTEGQKQKFTAAPEKYRRVVHLDGLRAIVSVLPADEYMAVMKDMGMTMDMAMEMGSYHVGVTLVDEESGKFAEDAGVKLIVSSPSGDVQEINLEYMPMMSHHGGGVKLPASGTYEIGVEATRGGETTESRFDYVVEGGGA